MRPFLLLIFCFFLVGSIANAQKTDTLYLYNGDRIVGEIKRLKYELLHFSTTGAGLIKVKWFYVAGLQSSKLYEIQMRDGSEFYGTLDSNSIENNIFEILPGLKETFDIHEIVSLTPIKKSFWSRSNLSVDLGFSFTKASDILNVNAGVHYDYTAKQNYIIFDYDLINTFRRDERTTARKQDLKGEYVHKFRGHYIYQGFTSLEQNSELGLNSRFNLGTTMGYQFFSTNKAELLITAGPQVSYETPLDDQPTRTNFEGIIIGNFKAFRVLDPELDIFFRGTYIPSFSLAGRYRVTTDINARIELLSDFFLKLSFYSTFDSDPVAEAASNDDWGINTTFSYKF